MKTRMVSSAIGVRVLFPARTGKTAAVNGILTMDRACRPFAAGMAGMPIQRIRPADIDIPTTSFSLIKGADLLGVDARQRLAATANNEAKEPSRPTIPPAKST
jgi:hypothetical protein